MPDTPEAASRVVAIVGPTATGKSDLALELADRLGGPSAVEIVNADAMQLYRGMDIGTAKVPVAQRRGIAHHQLDVLDVTQEASVATYQRKARRDLATIAGRDRRAILVGGSGLYVRAVLDHIEFPGTDPEVRARLEREAEIAGARALHDRLGRLDPTAAANVQPGNRRRVVRALEVIEITGRPFSATMPSYRYRIAAQQFAIHVPRSQLDEVIATRAERMVANGLVEETRALLDRGLLDGRTASRAVGYAQTIDLIRGHRTVAETIEAIAVATRQLARRQERWFRRDPRITWLEPSTRVVDDVLARL